MIQILSRDGFIGRKRKGEMVTVSLFFILLPLVFLDHGLGDGGNLCSRDQSDAEYSWGK